MKNLTLLTYTNSKAKDLWTPYFGRLYKHLKVKIPHVVLSDEVILDHDYSIDKGIIYDNSDAHYQVMISALNSIESDYVLYSQEDYIVYNDIDHKAIERFMGFMDDNSDIGFIRLIKSGVNPEKYDYVKTCLLSELFYIEKSDTPEYYYSTQATIWKKKVLLDMFEKSEVKSIFDEPLNSKHLLDMDIKGLCIANKFWGRKVGGHYDSLVWPYIATAKVKGRWNVVEYPTELTILFKEYNLDVH